MKTIGFRVRRAMVASLCLAGLCVAALPATAGPDDRLERVERREAAIERRLERVDARGAELAATVAELDRERARNEALVLALERRLRRLDARVARVQSRLEDAQGQLAILNGRLDTVRARLDASEEMFRERAISAYVAGPTTTLDALLSSEDLGDLLERYTLYRSALDADAELIDEIEVLEAEIARQRDVVQRKKDQIAADKAELQSHRSAVADIRDRRAVALAEREAAVAAKRSLLAQVRARGSRLRRIEEQLERESARIESLLAAQAFGTVPDALANGRLAWPAQGPLTSGFGPRTHPIFGDRRVHTGIDIAAPYGAPVWAAGRGVAVYVGTLSGYGNTVIVDHGGGLATTYNHLSGFLTSSGVSVARGQPIGRVGCTGYCTGPHLHFEVRVGGAPVDPLPYLR